MRPLCLLALLAACAVTLAPTASATAPAATAAKGCSVGDSRSYGTTCVLKISVRGTSCRSGKRLVRAFHDLPPRLPPSGM
jgi:hypothetical protein